MITALVFSAGYFGGCILAIFRHPIFGLLTYIAVFYLHPPSRWWSDALPELRWSLLAAAVTLVGVIVHKPSAGAKPFLRQGFVWGLFAFIAWLLVQSSWALNEPMHRELITVTVKYTLLLFLIYKCIETKKHLRYFLWTHVAGCFFLGMLAFNQYLGGRFEGFGGPGINEANAAGLQIVTGIIVGASLFLAGNRIEKIATIGMMPFIVNALVTTISRSGFLALAVGGFLYNVFVPKRFKGSARWLSILGLVLVVLVTNPLYWSRIGTIFVAGEQVEGVDTGAGRLVIIRAQFKMVTDYPFGCGHRCTSTLSPEYLDDKHLTYNKSTDRRARASHNTIMSLLVEQGIPGGASYFLLIFWIAKEVGKQKIPMRKMDGLIQLTYTAAIAVLGCISVGDIFVDYLKFETRFWFIGILMVLMKESLTDSSIVDIDLVPPENSKISTKG